MTLQDSVRTSVRAFVHQHIRYDVSCYVSDAVLLPAWYAVLYDNKNSVRDAVGDSVWDAVYVCICEKMNQKL
jgi:hypothetical protein